MTGTLALVRLMQLASPALPVGAFSYSQGLEAAIEAGTVRDRASAQRWIADALVLAVVGIEAPVVLRAMRAWKARDADAARTWNEFFIASRETAELRAETLQMGFSLRKLVIELDPAAAATLGALEPIAYPIAFAFAASQQGLDEESALAAYLFAWIENQALAALKAIPLGQTDGQRLIRDIASTIPSRVERVMAMDDAALSNFAPGLAIASSRHESQYSRIFRS